MNRRDAFKTLAGVFGAAILNPTELLASVRDPLRKPLRIVIPADKGFLINSVSAYGGLMGDCKILFPENMGGFSIPAFNGPLANKIYLAPGTVIEMPGECGSLLVLSGVSLIQRPGQQPDCLYETYWMDGRR